MLPKMLPRVAETRDERGGTTRSEPTHIRHTNQMSQLRSRNTSVLDINRFTKNA